MTLDENVKKLYSPYTKTEDANVLSYLMSAIDSLTATDFKRLKEALPKDSYDFGQMIVSGQERFNNCVNRVTSTTQTAVAQALKTAWYKDRKFAVPAVAVVGIATYLVSRGKCGKEKVTTQVAGVITFIRGKQK